MRAVVVTLVVLVLVAAGLFLLRDTLFAPEPEVATAPPPPAPVPEPAPAPADPAPDPAVAKLEQEAERFVEQLVEPDPEPVEAVEADHFVSPRQSISLLPEDAVVETTPADLLADPSVSPDTPITVVREAEEIEYVTPEQIIADAGGDMDAEIRVLEGEKVRETTVREVLERHADAPDRPISVVRTTRYYEKTTPRELAADESVDPDQPVSVIKERYAMESATVAELLSSEISTDEEPIDEDTVFYVRTVRPGDDQGIWGIIQHGLIENFAQGVAVQRGETLDTYRVDIPRDADERLSDRSSSFLGRMIHEKTVQSFVYNFKRGEMGRNPDVVNPGQEILIVRFAPNELIDIYKHFVQGTGAS